MMVTPSRKRVPLNPIWLYTVLCVQKNGDLGPLADLLRSDVEIGVEERKLLAALCDRFRLQKKRGGQLTPIGKMSARAKLANAAAIVRRVQRGELRYVCELTPNEIRAFGSGMSKEHDQPWMDRVKQIRGLRDAKGRMRKSDAISYVAEMQNVSPEALANFIDKRSGFSR